MLFAAREGHDEIVADLLDHGAALDRKDMVNEQKRETCKKLRFFNFLTLLGRLVCINVGML